MPHRLFGIVGEGLGVGVSFRNWGTVRSGGSGGAFTPQAIVPANNSVDVKTRKPSFSFILESYHKAEAEHIVADVHSGFPAGANPEKQSGSNGRYECHQGIIGFDGVDGPCRNCDIFHHAPIKKQGQVLACMNSVSAREDERENRENIVLREDRFIKKKADFRAEFIL